MSKFCTNCGKEMNEEEKFCSVCGTKQEMVPVKEEVSKKEEMKSIVERNEKTNIMYDNDINEDKKSINKSYDFTSAVFMCMRLMYQGRIYTSIKIDDNKMYISVDPKKKNKFPSIYLTDIVDVNEGFCVSNYCLYGAIFIALAGIASDPFYCIVGALVVYWLGINRKITIRMKGGKEAYIFSNRKKIARQFTNDVLEIIKR
ncbi:MAG: zinc-ribbon domain-containing protein [Lachnospiraceae bacterium]|nr:zinc-ribbon domain-containing protein [Lachnospiraceae bacterium]